MDSQSIVDALRTLQRTADALFDGDMDSYHAALIIEGSVASLTMDLNLTPTDIGVTLALPCMACGRVGCDGHCVR